MAKFDVSLALRAKDESFSAEIRDARGDLKGLANDASSVGRTIDRELSKPLGPGITNRVTAWRDTWNNASGSIRQGIGNMALQMQDVAVQLEGGASPLRVLLQQGTQIAGAFGPQGAIIGAIGAGVLLGIGALKSLGEDGFAVAERAAEDLEDALKEANRTLGDGAVAADKIVKAYEGLSGQSQGLGAVKLRQDMIDTKIATEEAQKAVQALVEEIEAASSARLLVGGSGRADIGGGFGPGSILAGEITRTQAEELQAVVARFESGGLDQVQLISEVQKVLAGATDEARQFVNQLIEIADKAETGRVSLGELAQAGPRIEALAAEAGVNLQQLGGSLDQVGAKVQENEGIWAQWYNSLVGNSYIPDTVTQSEIWFDRLGASMTSTTTEATANVADAFIGLDRQVSGTLARMITANELALQDFADFALDISTSILQGMIQIGIQEGLNFAFAPGAGAGPATGPGGLLVGGGVTSAGAVPVAHEGGIVGELARHRVVPASIFAGAERYHGGGMVLRSGEVPIIAQRGERITPAGQGGGPAPIVNVYAPPGSQVEQRQRSGQQGEAVTDVLIRMGSHAIARGDWDAAMSTRYGLKPGR